MIQKLTESLTESLPSSPPLDLTAMESRLGELCKEIQEFKQEQLPTQRAPLEHAHRECLPLDNASQIQMDCPEQPYELHKDQFLTDEELSQMADLLGYLRDSGDFVQENGHGVRLFGEPYKYTGSRSPDPEPIPPELQNIINRLKSDLSLEVIPKSVLINHFPARSDSDDTPCDSFLAMHSDDETSIVPE